MKKVFLLVLVLGLAAFIGVLVALKPWEQKTLPPVTPSEKGGAMKLTSSAFSPNQPIPTKYTCDGENLSPPLSLSDVPAGTVTLALIVDDPDAPFGTFTHWLVWNIAPEVTAITEGQAPSGALEGRNDFGRLGWGGPCPPSGTHRYRFRLYALDTKLSLASDAGRGSLEQAIAGHILAETELLGTYSRNQ